MRFSHCMISFSSSAFSIGTKPSPDVPLYSGYQTQIGGRDVELDGPVSKSQVPVISGTEVNEHNAEVELPSPLLQVLPMKVNSDSLLLQPNQPKFVTPVAFYGKVLEKPKTGPLQVFFLVFHGDISQNLSDTTLLLRVR